MAKYNRAIEVTFGDNDGRAGWRYNPEAKYDLARHMRIFGKWRTRWILVKNFWRGMILLEEYTKKQCTDRSATKVKLWVFKSEIPE